MISNINDNNKDRNKISVSNLDLYYGDFKALKNINIEIPE